ncbi:MAG: ammonia-forming cytochrome c nitrite reductase subunit c552 [Azoarcus sp.]|jgi:nitrite reductase (cytochrome c-552)|nr:ammonia-forming cytochrome c nitrite reductase subunit c552 [Azoarcus sp.]
MSKLAETIKRNPAIGWLFLLVVVAVVFVLGLLAAAITERRAETATLFNNKKVEITERFDSHNDKWGENYPREYNTWMQTQKMDFKSKYLGNAPEDVLESRPNMVVLWAGYAFSRDYSAPRGHWYTLIDMRRSLRTGAPGAPGATNDKDLQPGTCWTCKSPDVPRVMSEKGKGTSDAQMRAGAAEYYKDKWSAFGAEIVNPLGCADCHNPATMDLAINRPALKEVFERRGEGKVKFAAEGPNPLSFENAEAGWNVDNASPQDKRSLVCAQCHVEYFFKGDGKYLTFPWDKGFTVEDMEKYYDTLLDTEGKPYKDWVHALSKTPMLKAQHPDYELWLLGTHGKRGVSCADCHMPYKSEGGIKYTNHQIMSPLQNIAGTCQTCHRDSEEKLKSYVYDNQDKVNEIRDRVEPELAKAHIMVKALLDANAATDDELKNIRQLIREAGWRWDYGVASHGASFHAPVETARILARALDKSLLAQLELQKLCDAKGVKVAFPPLTKKGENPNWNKATAQAYIGLKMDVLRADKEKFIAEILPAWLKKAQDEGKLTDKNVIADNAKPENNKLTEKGDK